MKMWSIWSVFFLGLWILCWATQRGCVAPAGEVALQGKKEETEGLTSDWLV